MTRQLCIVFLMLFLGEIISHFCGVYLVASVASLLLLFIALCLRWVKEDMVSPLCDTVTKNIMVFFIVPTVGLMEQLDLLAHNLLQILVPVVLSTLVGLYVTAKAAELLLARYGKEEE